MKKFLWIKILVMSAFICTLLLTIFIFMQALTPGKKSAEISGNVSDTIKDIFDVDTTVKADVMQISSEQKGMSLYNGDYAQVKATIYPANTDAKIIYETTSQNASVDDLGVVSFFGTKQETVTIKAYSDINPEVSASINLNYYGISPKDERIEKLEIDVLDPLDCTSSYQHHELSVGKPYFISIRAKIKEQFLQDLNLDIDSPYVSLDSSPFTISIPNSDELFLQSGQHFTFLKAFNQELSFCFTQVADAHQANTNLVVLDDQIHNWLPDNFLEPVISDNQELLKISDNEYIVNWHYDCERLNIQSKIVSNKNTTSKILIEDQNNCVQKNGNDLLRLTNQGTFDVKLISQVVPELVTTIHINYIEKIPKGITITGDKRLIRDSQATYQAFLNEELYTDAEEAIVWSIVKGNDKISLSPNGVVVAKAFGNATIRATSVMYPDIYQDFTINVNIFSSFASFVRKMIGHFLLFGVLGFGISFSCWFLSKKRWLVCIISPIYVFLVAAISEILQLPIFTEGRGASFTDVMTDFLGGIIGMFIAMIIIYLTLLIWKIVHQKSYYELNDYINNLTLRSYFRKSH